MSSMFKNSFKRTIAGILATSLVLGANVNTSLTDDAAAADTKKVNYGDADCDGTVDSFDVALVRSYLSGKTDALTAQGKINADAFDPGSGITVEDLKAITESISGTKLPIKVTEYGDVNCDGEVDISDATLLSHYLDGADTEISMQGLLNGDVYIPRSGISIEDVRAIIASNSDITLPYGKGLTVTKYGDANCDGKIDEADVSAIVNGNLSRQGELNADVFQPGTGVTKEDAKAINAYISATIRSFPVNNLPNDDYDIGDDVWHKGWAFIPDKVNYNTDDKTRSKNSYSSIVIENTGFNDARIEKIIDVEPFSRYKISAMVKYSDYKLQDGDTETDSGASIGMIDSTDTSHHSDFTVSEKWTKLEYCFNTDKNTKATLFLRNGRNSGCCRGTAYFSDIRIEKVETTNQWNILAVIFKNVDADVVKEHTDIIYPDKNNPMIYKDELSSGQVNYIKTLLGRLKTTIPDFSADAMGIGHIEICEPEEPLKHINIAGDKNLGVIPESEEIKAIVEPYLKERQYDQIMFFAPLDGLFIKPEDGGPTSVGGGWYSEGINYCKFPGRFYESTDGKEAIRSELGFLHEILHGVEARSRTINPAKTLKLDTPSGRIDETGKVLEEGFKTLYHLDAAWDDDMYDEWYTAYMRGEINDGTNLPKGIDPAAYQVFRDNKTVLLSDDMTVKKGEIAPLTTATQPATTVTTSKAVTTTTKAKPKPTETVTTAAVKTTAATSKASLQGDANNDGKVNVADAVAVLQFIANKEKYPLDANGTANADCDGISGITGSDAIYIQKIDAGII